MKTKACILATICLVASSEPSHAIIETEVWNADGLSSFDLVISGSGGGFYLPNLISPSGLWKINGGSSMWLDTYDQKSMRVSASAINVMFNGTLPSYYTNAKRYNSQDPTSPSQFRLYALQAYPYEDYIPLNRAQYGDGEGFDDGALRAQSQGQVGWNGSTSIDFISVPDVHDSSTWIWTAHFYASGPALPAPVPEPGVLGLGLLGMLLAFGIRKYRALP